MARPAHQRLADRLERVRAVANDGVVKASDLRRTDRERLLSTGWLSKITGGWYLFHSPDALRDGDTAWYEFFWPFVRAYLDDRCADAWCLSAETSLAIHTGLTTLPRQVVAIAGRGGATRVDIPPGVSLLVYPDAGRLPEATVDGRGRRLMPLVEALTRVTDTWFRERPEAAEIALRMVANAGDLAARLLSTDRLPAAGRLVGAYVFLGEAATADQLRDAIERAGHTITPTNPFTHPAPFLSGRQRSPYAARVESMWARMRATVLEVWPEAPGLPADPARRLDRLEERAARDAYHSLSIEGYRVSATLIDRIRTGDWTPGLNATDVGELDALAASGYLRAFHLVRDAVARIFDGARPGEVAEAGVGAWHQELFQPMADAGLVTHADLLGYRRTPVYIRGARHVPPPHRAIPDAMEAFYARLHAEPEPAVRAILGHLLFTWIHPYADGNGRVARFLMNSQLTSGGYPWTTLRVDTREAYMAALDQAAHAGEIAPFARHVLSEMAIDP